MAATYPNPASLLLLDLHATEQVERAEAIARRWRAYHGQWPAPLKRKPGQPDDSVIVNYARVIVDKGVSFLFGQDIRFELDETTQTEAETWLAACWQENRQATLLHKLALNGAVAGHAFVKIEPGQPYPRLVIVDPAAITVQWDPRDIDTVLAYTQQWTGINYETRRPAYYRQVTRRDGGQWVVIDQQSEPDALSWITIAETPWPYAWPPILDCQNLPCPNEYYGISDIEDDVLRLNQALNFTLSNISRILRYHAHPKTWGRGFTAAQLSLSVDETIVLPNPEAELRNLEMQSDLAASIAFAERLREALHEMSRVPEVATGRLDNAGPLSGVALSILYQPLLEKTETKRRTYGDLLAELNRRLLALGGFGEDNRTVIHWPELLPSDPLQERQAALLDQQLGVSQDTILQRLGFDPDLERQKRVASEAEASQAMMTAFSRGQLGA